MSHRSHTQSSNVTSLVNGKIQTEDYNMLISSVHIRRLIGCAGQNIFTILKWLIKS